jgi:hypothetical protein
MFSNCGTVQIFGNDYKETKLDAVGNYEETDLE